MKPQSMRYLLTVWYICVSTAQYTPYGSYFVLSAQGPPIVSERLDPVIFPGVSPSPHVHEIYGGNKFQSTWNYELAQTSTCNNMGPKADHSNYWFPALYFHAADGSYTKVPPHLQIYYHFSTRDNGPRMMFPKGFRMIAGNPFLRHDDSANHPATKSSRWYCHGPDKISVGSFPADVSSCPGVNGFSGEIWFPFCFDGVNEFDAKDPYKHVTYASETQPQGGKCPSSHPYALPQLFMEFHHDIKDFAGKAAAADPWVLAPGDPTGFGMHADFINGWEDGPGSLKDAISVDPSDSTKTRCYTGESAEGAAACFELLPQKVLDNCRISSTIAEDVNGPIPSLPGCNPLQYGPTDATIPGNCAQPQPIINSFKSEVPPTATLQSDIRTDKAAPSIHAPSPVLNAASSSVTSQIPPLTRSTPAETARPQAAGSAYNENGSPAIIKIPNSSKTWTYQGCYSDLIPDRTIRTLSEWGHAGSGDSVGACIRWCDGAGFKFAGLEFGWQCFCGNIMHQTQVIHESKCNMKCDKAPSDICGGSSALSVYTTTAMEAAKPRGRRSRRGSN